eukprot:GHRR01032134.1.p1 GENE.GHRR01032134.1~~GHRR01032134.1.p1  ORF type:complete len:134 (-),score=32.39 GHRR01032134.1:71-472(-)
MALTQPNGGPASNTLLRQDDKACETETTLNNQNLQEGIPATRLEYMQLDYASGTVLYHIQDTVVYAAAAGAVCMLIYCHIAPEWAAGARLLVCLALPTALWHCHLEAKVKQHLNHTPAHTLQQISSWALQEVR